LQAEFVGSARDLYWGLETLSKGIRLQQAEWARVATGLRAGWRYFPSSLYAWQLETAFRQSKNRRGLFEFKAYRYFDEVGPNPFRAVGLFLRWLFVPGKKGYGEEIAAIKKRIKDDIMMTSPGVEGLPVFGGEKLFTSAGVSRLLAFADPASELYGKRAVFAFFDTTCSYCVEELKTLGVLASLYWRKSQGKLALIGVKIPNGLPPAIFGLAPFEKVIAVPFPLLENDASRMYTAYRVRSVPLLIFFDERGVPLWTVAIRGRGRLDEKLSWFLDDFLADVQSAPAVSAGTGPSPIVVDFYCDPSITDCRTVSDGYFESLAHSLGVGIEMVFHDLRVASVSSALEDRLTALRAIRSEAVVAILAGKVIQGNEAILRELPEVITKLVRSRR
jgi:hypothetical protein